MFARIKQGRSLRKSEGIGPAPTKERLLRLFFLVFAGVGGNNTDTENDDDGEQEKGTGFHNGPSVYTFFYNPLRQVLRNINDKVSITGLSSFCKEKI